MAAPVLSSLPSVETCWVESTVVVERSGICEMGLSPRKKKKGRTGPVYRWGEALVDTIVPGDKRAVRLWRQKALVMLLLFAAPRRRLEASSLRAGCVCTYIILLLLLLWLRQLYHLSPL